jgi:myo-inositol-1(or 4)-monophosphatase
MAVPLTRARQVRAFLADATPTVGFLGEEEGGASPSDGLMWTLDPVDGTANFANSISLCGVSLALLRDRRPVLGVIELPFLGNRYTAIEGQGAKVDGQPIQVSSVTSLHDAIVTVGDYAVGKDAERKNVPRFAIATSLAQRALRVRIFGSAAVDLAWLAEGKTGVELIQPATTAAVGQVKSTCLVLSTGLDLRCEA